MTSKAEELLERLAQIIIVAKCKCSLQRSKSMTHLECLYIDNWIVDELITSVRDNLNVRQMFSSPSTSSVLYTESLDSLK